MLRKSFRRGLGLGLLLGAALAIYKTLEARREVAAPAPQPWTPVSPPPPEPSVAKAPPKPSVATAPPKPSVPRTPPKPSVTATQPKPQAAPSPRPQPTPAPPRREPEPVPAPVEQPVDEVGEPIPEVPAAPLNDTDEITPAKKQSPRRAARAAKKTVAKKAAPAQPWVDPEGRMCPASHPVKAKLASKIFHVPGGFNYERTVPDRCYRDVPAAEGDGLRQSKR